MVVKQEGLTAHNEARSIGKALAWQSDSET